MRRKTAVLTAQTVLNSHHSARRVRGSAARRSGCMDIGGWPLHETTVREGQPGLLATLELFVPDEFVLPLEKPSANLSLTEFQGRYCDCSCDDLAAAVSRELLLL
jgi:hypothetical protein